jgi:benzoyl-CoA reductase/2-hydroxyglutaryl-CoA dehydratase subunit BcrC/BadD/HgdB
VKQFDFFHYLKVPHFLREDSLEYFTEELGLMRQAISEHFEVEISDDKLKEAIDVQDEVQAKLKELYRLREKVPAALTGAEVMQIICTGSSMFGKDFAAMLDEVLAEKRDATVPAHKARLIIMGSATDEVDLIADIESTGGLIAADALCFGSRSFWNREGESGDPMALLAERYLGHLFCPRMFTDYDRRIAYILDTARRAGVDGAIITYNKFCDLHGVESVSLRSDLEKAGFPVLVLEKDYGSKADTGRIKTRVQAFLEKLGK